MRRIATCYYHPIVSLLLTAVLAFSCSTEIQPSVDRDTTPVRQVSSVRSAPTAGKCRYFGVIRSVARTAEGINAHIDFMVLLADTLAMQAERDAEPWGWCEHGTLPVFPVNVVERIDTVPLLPAALLQLRKADGSIYRVDFQGLQSAFAHPANVYGLSTASEGLGRGIPGYISIDNGSVVAFDQQYFP